MPNVFETPDILQLPNIFSTDPVVYQTPDKAAQLQAVQMGIPGMQWADALSKYGVGLKLENEAKALAEQKQREEEAQKAANAALLSQLGLPETAANADPNVISTIAKQKIEEAKKKRELELERKKTLATAKALKIAAKKRGYSLSDEEAVALAEGGMKPPSLPSNKDGIAEAISAVMNGLPNVLNKPTANELEKGIMDDSDLLFKLEILEKDAKDTPDEIWTIPGRLASEVGNWGEKLGLYKATAKDTATREKYKKLEQMSQLLADQYRRIITGAAASNQELARIVKRMPDASGLIGFDSKTDFLAKLDQLKKLTKAGLARKQFLRSQGITVVPFNGHLYGRDENGNTIDIEKAYPIEKWLNESESKSESSNKTKISVSNW